MKFSLRHADKFVGFFFVIALVFLTAALMVLGVNQRWFVRDVFYRTEFSTASGLSRNMQIRLSGFEIGKVHSFTLTEQNRVDVRLIVYEEFQDRIHPGSIVDLKSNPLGLGSELVFYPGADKSEILAAESLIPSRNSDAGRALIEAKAVQLPSETDTVSVLLAQAEPLMVNVNSAVLGLNKALTGLTQLTASLRGGLDGTSEGPIADMLSGLVSITQNTDSLVQNQITNTLNDIGRTTQNFSQLSSELSSADGLAQTLMGAEGSLNTIFNDGNELYDSIAGALRNTEAALASMAELARGLSRTTPQISAALNQTLQVLDQTRDVMEGLSNNPLLRGGISEQQAIPAEQGGYRDAEF